VSAIGRGLLSALLVAGPADMALSADRTVRAERARAPIVLDGVLDEASWRLATPATGFVQSEPRQGEPATEATEVRILFDDDTLYFGVTCFDVAPSGIRARSLRVDFSPADEDIFQIILDPFASSRDGFLFIINPYGARRDEQISNEGRESNVSWDAEWDVRTRRHEEGWTAEIRIPLKSLRYSRHQDRPWKVNFGRQIRRHNEVVHWAEIPRQLNVKQVSLAGELTGLEQGQLRPGRNLLATPYLVLNRVGQGRRGETDGDIGADLKYGLTPGLTLDATYNTDFSHVEVDQQQVNLDRFRLSFPEKRDFFLENASIFDIGSVALGMPTPEDPTVFYSRNIGLSLDGRPVPVRGGARVTGRAGPYGIGVMSLQTGAGEDQGPENATVLRVRRDVLTRSWFGGFFASRQGRDRLTNRVFGVDGLYRPINELTVSSYFAQSQTPGVHADDWAWRFETFYNSRRWHAALVHANVQDDYNADLGFVLRKGITAERVEVRPRFRPWQTGPFRDFQPVLNVRYVGDTSHHILSREQASGIDVFFADGAFLRYRHRQYFERLSEDFDIRRGIVIATGDYHFTEQGLEYNTDRSRALSASARWYTGEFWNGRKTSWEATGQLRPSAHLSTSLQFTQDDVTLPAGDFTANLLRVRLQYAFNSRTFLDTFIQYNSERDAVTSNLRFNWIHRPLSDLFVVYTEERGTVGAPPTNRVFSIKYTHLLSL
jgi:hypothetical protein